MTTGACRLREGTIRRRMRGRGREDGRCARLPASSRWTKDDGRFTEAARRILGPSNGTSMAWFEIPSRGQNQEGQAKRWETRVRKQNYGTSNDRHDQNRDPGRREACEESRAHTEPWKCEVLASQVREQYGRETSLAGPLQCAGMRHSSRRILAISLSAITVSECSPRYRAAPRRFTSTASSW